MWIGKIKSIPFSRAIDCFNEQLNTIQQTWGMEDTVTYILSRKVYRLSVIPGPFAAETSSFKVTRDLIDWIPKNKIWKHHFNHSNLEPIIYAGFGGVTERNGLFKPKHIINSACSFL